MAEDSFPFVYLLGFLDLAVGVQDDLAGDGHLVADGAILALVTCSTFSIFALGYFAANAILTALGRSSASISFSISRMVPSAAIDTSMDRPFSLNNTSYVVLPPSISRAAPAISALGNLAFAAFCTALEVPYRDLRLFSPRGEAGKTIKRVGKRQDVILTGIFGLRSGGSRDHPRDCLEPHPILTGRAKTTMNRR